MLRPERMSKVSVTGSKGVMSDVVETIHGLSLLHISEYDGSWEGFSRGDPMAGAEDASDKLVTVRSIESILGVEDGDARPARSLDDDELDERLEAVRTRVNELEDRRVDLREELRDVEERLDRVEPFADLGIDLDLLQGYDSLQVVVAEGRPDGIERALADADGLASHEVFAGERTVAVLARPAEGADEDALEDALVGVDVARLEVPSVEGDSTSPSDYAGELRERHRQLRAKLDTAQNELEEVKAEAASFVLAAEEQLAVTVEKTEVPLTFATTENAFVAEGWIPTERYAEFASALDAAVGDHVEVEELERAAFTHDGSDHVREEVGGSGQESGVAERPTPAADGGADADAGTEAEARADGGAVVTRRDDPPVVQNNSGAVKPFELLVQAVGRPKYYEFDPTIILFLTFPAFFGFMIGDLGYGIVYALIGYYLYSRFDSDVFRSMGGVTIAAGLFTMLFGVLYGEFFGLHALGEVLFGGHPPMEKGLSPAGKGFALTWLVISVLVGILHLNVGYVLDFVEGLELHDLRHAVTESGSWILMLNGVWVWILSRHAAGSKPNFLFTVFDGSETAPESTAEFVSAHYALGFNGFAPEVGIAAAVVAGVGFLLLLVGEPIELVEVLNVLVNALSYTRIAAVLLAKAGMAFTVNLLFFGAYVHDGEFHFLIDHTPGWVVSEYGAEAIMFNGLMHGGVAFLFVGLFVLVLGHLLVLALGVTSAGLQAVRLEYVEFFSKFYEGGGREYRPFGGRGRATEE